VARYARLGIPEYFLYDRARNRLAAYRLASPDAGVYTPIVPNHGLYESRVLGLEVQVDEDRLRFYAGTALLLESEELIARVQAMYDSAQRRADEEAQRREEAERLREEEARLRAEAERLREEEARRRAEAERLRAEEARRRAEAEQEVARLREEIERLKR
jgi:flagellar biosynthesis GTPase FlhF